MNTDRISNIISFYSDQCLLITGGTGFLGKVLLEKILRSIPDVKKIYVLLRPKNGLSPDERITKMLQNKPFTFNGIDERQFEKVKPLNGDITEKELGLSSEDKDVILNDVTIVHHLAASVRFDLALKDAVIQNLLGTKEVLDLCKKIKHLKSVVHLSTAYCNVDVSDVEEKVYDFGHITPYRVMEMITKVKDDELAVLEKSLIYPHPNTYTFTKRLAEILARDIGNELPLVIVRPSIVLPAYQEPVPGWVDTIYGPTGVFLAAGKGVLQVALIDKNCYPELIPVDIAINILIAASYVRAINVFSKTPIYNATQTSDYNVTWGYIMDSFMRLSWKYPLQKVLWHCNGYITTNKCLYEIGTLFLHFLPGFIIDFLLMMCLQEPFLIKIHKRLYQGMKLVSFFTTRSFMFRTEKMETLINYLNDQDLQQFYLFDRKLEVDDYIARCYMGGRKYCAHDEPSDNWIWTFQYCV